MFKVEFTFLEIEESDYLKKISSSIFFFFFYSVQQQIQHATS